MTIQSVSDKRIDNAVRHIAKEGPTSSKRALGLTVANTDNESYANKVARAALNTPYLTLDAAHPAATPQGEGAIVLTDAGRDHFLSELDGNKEDIAEQKPEVSETSEKKEDYDGARMRQVLSVIESNDVFSSQKALARHVAEEEDISVQAVYQALKRLRDQDRISLDPSHPEAEPSGKGVPVLA